tara:strand:- start:1013 stop:1828 length:816 start_codon:yes stop_codon:yes gene_type:complete
VKVPISIEENAAAVAATLRRRRVRAFWVSFVVIPFLPASNVFFYVGTYIGEVRFRLLSVRPPSRVARRFSRTFSLPTQRLLYVPSVGACVLAADFLEALSHSPRGSFSGRGESGGGGDKVLKDRRSPRERGRMGSSLGGGESGGGGGLESENKRKRKRRRRLSFASSVASKALAATALVLAAAKTTRRNLAWKNDATLFAAARETCPNSAKTLVNLGILGERSALVPIRPRRRGERRSLRTFPGVSLRPRLAFNTRPRRLSTPPLTPFNSA